ncbi:condensation domain-containing protein (plasmid) [Clostridium butyricum]|uniref:condensation domain-containing protein n=1 Tax=Clostridium butyricum TaxID=1492 RepID=UPI003D0C3101
MLKLDSLNINDNIDDICVKEVETNDIAIIGICGKFPNSEEINEFWENLRVGKDYINELSEKRREDLDKFIKYMSLENENIRYREGAYINEIDEFDYEFFRLSAKEASLMDPNQRLFLQTAWNCIEDAGYADKKIMGTRTGVFVGYSSSSSNQYRQMVNNIDSSNNSLSLVGNIPSIIASRISYMLDLKGPSMLIDTACSSSLVSVHLACQSIRNNECDMAIAGASKLEIFPFAINEDEKIGIESSSGRARTFDDDSDGTGGGEGVISILLKPLDKAIEDKDNIYAVIKGSAINQDGNSIGITAPNAVAQEDVIIRAWKNARIDPETISYIEAHGTGTKLGDPIEIDGIERAFRRYTNRKQFCGIGSIKTNIGHLDNAAGVMSLIKVVMSLKNNELVPTIHFKRPNKKINFIESPVYVNNKLLEWNHKYPKRAGINSFGISGTNCHMVFEEAPKIKTNIHERGMNLILTLSAKTKESLKMLLEKYNKLASAQFYGEDLYNICYSASTRRMHYKYRLAVIVKDFEDLNRKLSNIIFNNFEKVEYGVFYSELKEHNSINSNRDISTTIQIDKKNDYEYLSELCMDYVIGKDIDWDSFYNNKSCRNVSLPVYQFKKTRCWVDIPDGPKYRITKEENKIEESDCNNVELSGRENKQYSNLEMIIANIWGQVLGIKKLDIRTNLYELGGDSIIALKIANLISKKLKIEISISQVLEYQTVGAFALEVSKNVQMNNVSRKITEIKQLENKEYYETSSSQKRIYILNDLNTSSTVYNLPSATMIYGKIDKRKFEGVINKLIERHESLRTSFDLIDGEVVQKINKNISTYIEYSKGKREDIDNIIKSFIRPFNLKTAPLIRVGLIKINENEHLLLTDMHHIISDGTSINILLTEFMNLYMEKQLPELKIQYKEYSKWQNELMNSSYIKESEKYWINMFKEDRPILNMPISYIRPSIKSIEGDRVEAQISLELTKQLNKFCEKTQSTLYMTLLAAYYILLYKYTGDEDIVVGSPVSGRMNSDIENVVGMFVNTIAIRNYPAANKTINEFINEVKNNAIKAFMHQDYPFDVLVDKLNVERDTSRNPLFDTMFIMQNMQKSHLKLDEIEFEDYNIPSKTIQFDLTLNAIEKEGKINFSLDYCTKLFDREFIEQLLENYINLLKVIVEKSETKLIKIDMLSNEEKNKLLVEFNKNEVEYSRDLTICEVFEQQVKKYPNNIAVNFYGEQLTYRELNDKANSLAVVLRENGVKANTIVALAFERSIETVISIIAILKSGGAFMYIDMNFPTDRVHYMLNDAAPKVLLINNKSIGKIKDFKGTIININNVHDLDYQVELPIISKTSDTSYIIYTSGSTGKPKGVEVINKGVVNLANWQKENFKISPNSHISQFATYSFDGAIGETFMALLNGATLVMIDREELSSRNIINSINKNNINVIVLTPAMLTQLDVNKIMKPNELTIVSVGEECPFDLGLKWAKKCTFANAYGPTEYTVYSHNWFFDKEEIENKKQLPIGKAMYNTKTYILNSELKPVPIGVAGEIYLSGEGIAKGYLNNINKSSMTFMVNPFNNLMNKYYEEVEYEFKDIEIDSKIEDHAENEDREEVSKEKLMELIKEYDEDIIQKTEQILSSYKSDDPLYKCLVRYFCEGFKNSYKSYGIDEKLIKLILPFESFNGLSGVDFGFGNGEVLKIINKLGAEATGFDLSPSFVQCGRNNGLNVCQIECDSKSERFQQECNIKIGTQDFVITNLTLDRLNNPSNFIKNMFSVLKQGGRFAIQTLLPVNCIDDEDINEPIVYTPEENRITFGKSEEQDKMAIITLLREFGGRNIKVCKFPYYVSTITKLNKYECWSFFGIYRPDMENYGEDDFYSKMYKTGDLGKFDQNGNVEFIGRVDNMVKIRGFRIELGEIEAKLLKHNDIREALVTVNDKDKNDKRIYAYIVTNRKLTIKELREFLSQYLPDYMIPADFIALDKIPLNSSGKVDRKRLPEPVRNIEDGIQIERPKTNIEIQLAKVWEKVLGIKNIDVNSDFFELGGNSIKAIQVISNLESNLNIRVNDIFKHKTIRAIARNIGAIGEDISKNIEEYKAVLKAKMIEKEPEYSEELLDYNEMIKNYKDKDLKDKKEYKNILLVGSTGYLGIHLLKDILENTDSNLILLVRGDSEEQAKARLVNKFCFYFTNDLYSKYRERITVVKGDFTKENFGLNLYDYIKLSRQIDCIINSAANVKHYGFYEEFYEVNVKGTERLINFAMTGRQKDYNHVSTISIASGKISNKENVVFTEEDCDLGQAINNFYVESKFNSEKELLKMRKQGININIFRVGNLVFDSSTGIFQENINDNAFYTIIKSLIKIGKMPNIDMGVFDFSFVDYVSSAITLLFNKEKLMNETFHVYNHKRISFKSLAEKIQKVDINIQIQDGMEFLDFILKNRSNEDKKEYIDNFIFHSQLLKKDRDTNFKVISDKTKLLLDSLGFAWDEVDDKHIRRMLDYCKNINYI